jgi:hypothetical protein
MTARAALKQNRAENHRRPVCSFRFGPLASGDRREAIAPFGSFFGEELVE